VELRHLRYFVAVAEELHFGRAAQRLHIVQPALSKQIAGLEAELGVRLFHRTKRSVTITDAGQAFYDEVRSILQRIEQATEIARRTAAGEIGSLAIGFIGPAMWSLLPDTLREHRRRFPGVRFHLEELPSMMQLERLRQGALDAAFVRLPLNEHDGIDLEIVLRERFVVTVPERHPCAAATVVDLSSLADESFVLTPRRIEPGYYDQCIRLCHAHGFTPKIVEEGNGPAAICGMVATGLGVTLSPASILNVPWRGVVYRDLLRPSLDLELAVGTRTEEPSSTLRSFVETLHDVAAGFAVPPPRLATAG
jgi:DNA-binding transcriptional LysR family regulator